MSSLTGQESSNTQPKNPVNLGEDTTDTFKGDSSVPFKTGGSTDPAGLSVSADKVSFPPHMPPLVTCVFCEEPYFASMILTTVVCTRPAERLGYFRTTPWRRCDAEHEARVRGKQQCGHEDGRREFDQWCREERTRG